MKLIASNGAELDVKKYAMPAKGTDGTVSINGEEVATKLTSGRGKDYTYFRIKNVDLYVAGKLEGKPTPVEGQPEAAEVTYTLELPEGFGSENEPAPRKSYYVRKRPAKPLNADGSIPAGEGADPDADKVAAHTDPTTGEAVVPTTGEADDAGAPPEDGGEGADPLEGTVAPKARRRK